MKKRISYIIFFGIVLATIFIIFLTETSPQKSRPRDLKQIKLSGKLSVLMPSSNVGFQQLNDSTTTGFQYEIMKAFANRIGVELNITPINDLSSAFADIENHKFDMLANFIPYTLQLDTTKVRFSHPILLTRYYLVQQIPETSAQRPLIRKLYDLAHDTIYLQMHSPQLRRIEHLMNEIADTIYTVQVENTSVENLISQVADGKIAYTICPGYLTRNINNNYPTIDVKLPIGFMQQQVWVLQKGATDLQKELNLFLDEFVESTEYWAIYRKYL